MMAKRISIIISVLLCASLLVGCSQAPEKPLEGIVAYAQLASITYGEKTIARFVEISSNESIVEVDTNPSDMVASNKYDREYLAASEEVAMIFVESFNEILGLEELTDKMTSTTSSDGTIKKSYKNKGVRITWSNSNSRGLEVKYEVLK